MIPRYNLTVSSGTSLNHSSYTIAIIKLYIAYVGVGLLVVCERTRPVSEQATLRVFLLDRSQTDMDKLRVIGCFDSFLSFFIGGSVQLE